MSIVNDTSFSFNKQFKYNFNGGELSSDGGLFLLKEFANRIGFEKVIRDNTILFPDPLPRHSLTGTRRHCP